jgi:hypothetical protein
MDKSSFGQKARQSECRYPKEALAVLMEMFADKTSNASQY